MKKLRSMLMLPLILLMLSCLTVGVVGLGVASAVPEVEEGSASLLAVTALESEAPVSAISPAPAPTLLPLAGFSTAIENTFGISLTQEQATVATGLIIAAIALMGLVMFSTTSYGNSVKRLWSAFSNSPGTGPLKFPI